MTTRELILKNITLGAIAGKIKRFEIVELGGVNGVPNGLIGRAAFEDQPQLRDQSNQVIIITNIELFVDTVYRNSQYTNALPGFPPGEIPKACLVMYVNGEESARLIPLAKLNHINDQLNPFEFDNPGFDNLQNVDWDKSYVQFASATAGGPYVIPFGVSYLRFQLDPVSNSWVEK